MSLWPTKRLSEVCAINPRANGSAELRPDAVVSFVPMAAINESRGRIEQLEDRTLESLTKSYTPFREGDVLFAKITPCMENGKSAIARGLRGGVGFGSTEFHVLRPGPDIMAEWLLALVRRPGFRDAAKASFTGTAGHQRVPVRFLSELELPVPPMAEQRRLVAQIGSADELSEMATRADGLTEDMYRSLYLELFGGHPRRADWGLSSIEELLAEGKNRIRTGPFGSQLLHSEFTDQGIPVLGIPNVVTNRFSWTAGRCIARSRFEEFKRYQVFGEDVLISIMGTVGRCCVAPADLPTCISTKHLCVITLDRSAVEPTYVWAALLFDPEVRQQTSAAGGGAIMHGWNSKIIRGLRLRLPPLKLQQAFTERVADVRGLEDLQAARRGALEDLNASLVDCAVEGVV
jgi:type I restriction enzyme, S subunit